MRGGRAPKGRSGAEAPHPGRAVTRHAMTLSRRPAPSPAGRCAPRRSTAAFLRVRVAPEFPRLRPRTALARSSSRSELLVCGSYCPRGRSPKTPRGRGYEPRTAGTAAPRSVFGTSPEAPSREPGWRYEYPPRNGLSIGKVRRGRFQNMRRTRSFRKSMKCRGRTVPDKNPGDTEVRPDGACAWCQPTATSSQNPRRWATCFIAGRGAS